MAFLRAFKNVILGEVEELSYDIVKNSETYEERHYGAAKYACTRLSSGGRDAINRDLFMKLFHYVNGENEGEVRIAMTTPVITRVDPGEEDNTKTYTMAFYMPKNCQESDLPKPKNLDVFIETWPEMNIVTRTFGGYAKDLHYNTEKVAMEELVKDEPDIVKEYYYEVGYDPPFKPLRRRNELWLVKKHVPPKATSVEPAEVASLDAAEAVSVVPPEANKI